MKPHDDPESPRNDAAFDAAMRARHQQATEQLSAHARLRLDAARRATPASITAGRAPLGRARVDARSVADRPVAGWALAGAFAVVAVVAIALQLRIAPVDTPVNQVPVASVIPDDANATDPAADPAADPAIVLDENPDLYLWLAANDDAPPSSLEY